MATAEDPWPRHRAHVNGHLVVQLVVQVVIHGTSLGSAANGWLDEGPKGQRARIFNLGSTEPVYQRVAMSVDRIPAGLVTRVPSDSIQFLDLVGRQRN